MNDSNDLNIKTSQIKTNFKKLNIELNLWYILKSIELKLKIIFNIKQNIFLLSNIKMVNIILYDKMYVYNFKDSRFIF